MMFCLSLILLGFVVPKISSRIHKHPQNIANFQDVGVKNHDDKTFWLKVIDPRMWDCHRMNGNFSSFRKLIYLFKYPVHYETSEQKQNWHNK